MEEGSVTPIAELAKASTLLSERSVVPSPRLPVSAARPVGAPLVARDAYGSRFLVAAPFGYEANVPDHWYAWDVDACWTVSVAAAGTFGSADEALAEWRGAVGAAADSELSPGDPGLVAKPLGPCLQTGALSNMLHGNEPRELVRECRIGGVGPRDRRRPFMPSHTELDRAVQAWRSRKAAALTLF